MLTRIQIMGILNTVEKKKTKIVAHVLKGWKEQGHRVVRFTQTQQILDILENCLIASC